MLQGSVLAMAWRTSRPGQGIKGRDLFGQHKGIGNLAGSLCQSNSKQCCWQGWSVHSRGMKQRPRVLLSGSKEDCIRMRAVMSAPTSGNDH